MKGASKKIKELLKEQKKLHNFESIKNKDGVRAYLQAKAQHEDEVFPSYWTHYKGLCSVILYQATPKRSELNIDSDLYVAVNNLVQFTWDKLTQSTIQIIKIWLIENPNLYQKYLTQKRYLYGRACINLFPKIDKLDGECEVQTKGLGMMKVSFHIECNNIMLTDSIILESTALNINSFHSSLYLHVFILLHSMEIFTLIATCYIFFLYILCASLHLYLI